MTNGQATNSENTVCNQYPYSLKPYRSALTIFTLDLLNGTRTFESTFSGGFATLMQDCKSRVDEALVRFHECISSPIPDAKTWKDALDAVSERLNSSTTLRQLMEIPQSDWPAGLFSAMNDLRNLGFYINAQLIPKDAKEEIRQYFSGKGDDFLGRAGSISFKEYFENPRDEYTPEILDLLYRGRRIGVLLCHPESFVEGDKDGRCWDGTDCQETTLDKTCNGNTASSDPC